MRQQNEYNIWFKTMKKLKNGYLCALQVSARRIFLLAFKRILE